MKTINLKCDRCGASETVASDSESKLQLCNVGIGVHDPRRYYHGSTVILADLKNMAEWCRKCCLEVGLSFQCNQEEAKVKNPPPTLEDLIRELVVASLKLFRR